MVQDSDEGDGAVQFAPRADRAGFPAGENLMDERCNDQPGSVVSEPTRPGSRTTRTASFEAALVQMESPNIDAAGRPGHLGPGASGCSNYADSQYDRLELIDDPAQSLRLVCLHRTRSTRIPALAHAR